MTIDNLFHEGELMVQKRTGEAEIAQRNSGAVSDAIPKGALGFIQQQSIVVLGSINPEGKVWATLLVGEPGFLSARDDRTVILDIAQPRSSNHDPFWNNIKTNEEVGMLVIELASRRRLRINGRIRYVDDTHLELTVVQAYPNCPKYIQRRNLMQIGAVASMSIDKALSGSELTDNQQSLIANADTFFVASMNPGHGVDASHRGGQPGFVQVLGNGSLRIPDYMGNSMFNTLGNIAAYPQAGLVFVDFENNRVLQISGRAEIFWDQDDPYAETGGTQRYWGLTIEHWIETPLPRELHWELLDYSPYNPLKTSQQISAAYSENDTMQLTITRVHQETDRIKSFQLANNDGTELPAFTAGAHLPVTVTLPDGKNAQRHYSILSSPVDRNNYQIAVLLEPDGRGGSQFMHQQIHEGDIIEVGIPKNDFPLAENVDHHILIAGGIGITPILSMLRSLAADKASFEVHYTGRSASGLAYRNEVETLSKGHAHFYASQDSNATRLNLDKLLSKHRPGTHVYVCGPVRLIEAVRDISKQNGWPSDHIHFESFGVASKPDDKEISLTLSKSGQTLTVQANQTILDALISADVIVPYDCKRGECGMCVTSVVSGEPDHRDVYLNADEREYSMCLCVSRAKTKKLIIDL